MNPLGFSVDTPLEKLWALRRLSEQPFDRQEREILQQLHRQGGEAVQRFIRRFGFNRITLAVHRWHGRFRKSLSPEPPRESILCAFTSVVDRLVDQDDIKALLQWAARQLDVAPGTLLEQAARRAESGVNSRGGMATAPPDVARMASAITSMHAAIGNSRSTSCLLMIRIRVF